MNLGTGKLADLRPSGTFRSDFLLKRELPAELAALDRISMNFAWSWLPGGTELFRDLEPRLWDKCEQNPRLLLKRIDELTLTQWAADAEYVERVDKFDSELQKYLAADHRPPTTAYFCAEYGIHNSLPNYSGGLGILAG